MLRTLSTQNSVRNWRWGERSLPWAARTAMRAFDRLFRWNRTGTMRGWQRVARAVEPLHG